MNPGHLSQIIRGCNKIAALETDLRGLFSKILINVIKSNQKQAGYTAKPYVIITYTYLNAYRFSTINYRANNFRT
jgi:hypothetical protein